MKEDYFTTGLPIFKDGYCTNDLIGLYNNGKWIGNVDSRSYCVNGQPFYPSDTHSKVLFDTDITISDKDKQLIKDLLNETSIEIIKKRLRD